MRWGIGGLGSPVSGTDWKIIFAFGVVGLAGAGLHFLIRNRAVAGVQEVKAAWAAHICWIAGDLVGQLSIVGLSNAVAGLIATLQGNVDDRRAGLRRAPAPLC